MVNRFVMYYKLPRLLSILGKLSANDYIKQQRLLLMRYYGKKLLVTPSLEFHPSAQFAESFRMLYRQNHPLL